VGRVVTGRYGMTVKQEQSCSPIGQATPPGVSQTRPVQHGVELSQCWPSSAHSGMASGLCRASGTGGGGAAGIGFASGIGGASGVPGGASMRWRASGRGRASGGGGGGGASGGGGGGGFGFSQVPVSSPGGITHSRPVQQSAVEVQTPCSGM